MASKVSYAWFTSCSNWSSGCRFPGAAVRGSFSFACCPPLPLHLFRRCQFSVQTWNCASRLTADFPPILRIAFRADLERAPATRKSCQRSFGGRLLSFSQEGAWLPVCLIRRQLSSAGGLSQLWAIGGIFEAFYGHWP